MSDAAPPASAAAAAGRSRLIGAGHRRGLRRGERAPRLRLARLAAGLRAPPQGAGRQRHRLPRRQVRLLTEMPMEAESLPKIVPPLPRPNEKARNLPRGTARRLAQGRVGGTSAPTRCPACSTGCRGLRGVDLRRLGDVPVRGRLLPLPGPQRLHGARPADRDRPLREEPAAGAGRAHRPRLGCSSSVPPRPTRRCSSGSSCCSLFMLWQRAAVLLYALHMGVRPFPGFDEIVRRGSSPPGWAGRC